MIPAAKHLQRPATSLDNLTESLNRIALGVEVQSAHAWSPKRIPPEKKSNQTTVRNSSRKTGAAKGKPSKDAQKATRIEVVLQTMRRAKRAFLSKPNALIGPSGVLGR